MNDMPNPSFHRTCAKSRAVRLIQTLAIKTSMRFILALASLLLASCSQLQSDPRPDPSGQVRIAELLGKWCTLTRNGRSCSDHHEYREDLTYRSCGIDTLYNTHAHATARVQLVSNTVCLKILDSSDTTLSPIGYEVCSEIVEIKPDFIRYKLTGRTEVFLAKRLSGNSAQCPPLTK